MTGRSFVREHCWLVNMNARRDGFLSIDMAQEHNIKDIKVSALLKAVFKWTYRAIHQRLPIARKGQKSTGII